MKGIRIELVYIYIYKDYNELEFQINELSALKWGSGTKMTTADEMADYMVSLIVRELHISVF